MKQQVKYKSYYELDFEKPHIELGFRFNDYFETNDYYLISESKKYKSIDSINFELIKDNKVIGNIVLENLNIDDFINKFSDMTSDHDFKKIIISEHKNKITKDMSDFFELYKTSILNNKFTLEGEIKRMKAVAGII